MDKDFLLNTARSISTPQARERFLEKSCGSNPRLREEISQILATEQETIPQISQGHTSFHAEDESTADKQLEDESDAAETLNLIRGFLKPPSKPGCLGSLGSYEILETLGQGGFGTVLKAFDTTLHRVVAIKFLSSRLAATSPPRKLFLREARAAAAVNHENIVRIYTAEEQPLPYLVMEFVKGMTLQQKMDLEGPVDLLETLKIGKQIASGLAAAHAAGLIHRDIKPSNILIESKIPHQLKITDFGLARAANDASLTRSGVITGTPLYMSPEQARGKGLDFRTDLFSLGSVLYTMACGHPAFRASNNMAVLRRVIEDTPRPLQQTIPDLPNWFVTLVDRLMAKDPADRFASTQEVANLLDRCLSDLQNNRPIPIQAITGTAGSPTIPANTTTLDHSSPRLTQKLVENRAALLAITIPLVSLGAYLIGTRSNQKPVESQASIAPQTTMNEDVSKATATTVIEDTPAKQGESTPVANTLASPPRPELQQLVARTKKPGEIDRTVAEWLVGQAWAGWIQARNLSGQEIKLNSTSIPTEDFFIAQISVEGDGAEDADLAVLAMLPRLSKLSFFSSEGKSFRKITDAGMKSLASPALSRSLEKLQIGVFLPNVTQEGFLALNSLNELRTLAWTSFPQQSEFFTGLILPNLQTLAVSEVNEHVPSSNIPGGILQNLNTRMPKLERLNIGPFQLSHDDLIALADCASLAQIELYQTPVDDDFLKDLTKIQGLERLQLTQCRFTATAPGFARIGALPKLKSLQIHETLINDDICKSLAGLPSVEVLHVSLTDITDAGLDELKSSHLKEINLERNPKITSEGIESLKAALPNCKIVHRE